MIVTNRVILRQGKDKAIRNRHHWIFSGAIQNMPEGVDGAILPVYSADQILLGSAYFNSSSAIAGRMVAFGDMDPYSSIRKNIEDAVALRQMLFDDKATNAYRLINGEGDCLPGLIVDKYNDVLAVQIGTKGMELLKSFIVENLIRLCRPRSIYEKSLLLSRKEEGLTDLQGVLQGEDPGVFQIQENGLHFYVAIKEGQKTGFFLDQREMRQKIREIANGKKVLNCFSYTGGFSVYAAAGGATVVDSIDISAEAIDFVQKNMELNWLKAIPSASYATDVFQYLRERPLDYDIVILDPPAFAKRQKDIVQACRGYKDINRVAMKKMPRRSLLLTCSCSYHVDADLFQKVVFQAAVEAGRTVKILGRHRLAPDHPINLCHPEGDYLKSLLLYIE